MSIEQQVVVAMFIKYTLDTETISEYKIQGKQLLREVLSFAEAFEESKLGFTSNLKSGQEYRPVGEPDEEDDIIDDDDDEVVDHAADG